MLIRLDQQQLGWMAADCARQSAEAACGALLVAEAARQLTVLARKANWHEQAMSLALTVTDQSGLCGGRPDHAAERDAIRQSGVGRRNHTKRQFGFSVSVRATGG
ncbi:hypothetical protein [Streptomyces klenkii]|uniref:hypothetical protein n=1 Tax=Streptomyces klenkii TaxID=1420899 RepID=UPI00343C97DE